MQKFYDATKRVFGPQRRSLLPVRGLDGVLIKDNVGIRERRADHFCTLLNHTTNTDHSILEELPSLPILHDLDREPSFEEVKGAITTLKMNKAAGPDAVPAELLKYGGVQLHTKLHQIVSQV